MQHIDATIADIGSIEHLIMQNSGNTGSSYAEVVCSQHPFHLISLVDSGVRLLDGFQKGRGDIVLKILIVVFFDLLNGQFASNFAEIATTHTVRDYKKRALCS